MRKLIPVLSTLFVAVLVALEQPAEDKATRTATNSVERTGISLRISYPGLNFSLFPLSQQEQQGQKRKQGQSKEDRTTTVMQIRIDPIGIYPHTKLRQDEDAKAVSKERKRNDGEQDNELRCL